MKRNRRRRQVWANGWVRRGYLATVAVYANGVGGSRVAQAFGPGRGLSIKGAEYSSLVRMDQSPAAMQMTVSTHHAGRSDGVCDSAVGGLSGVEVGRLA